jgi:DUF1680 family protein
MHPRILITLTFTSHLASFVIPPPAFALELTPDAMEQQLLQATPLPLHDVRLTGGPLLVAQQLDGKYLLDLEPERMLAYYRKEAGLPTAAEPYGGWDGGGRNLTGHVAGHYLSAVSLMWAATGDPRFKERADLVVRGLQEVQDAHGDGYLCALEGGRECWADVRQGNIRSGGFDLNGLWAPWYTLHKTFAGLRDAYRFTDNPTALAIEIKFAAWVESLLAPLNTTQIQKMLETEFGGMNEVMVDLYADTQDPRWLNLSYKFEHLAITGPLALHQDILPGKHGNTQVPKLIGTLDRYIHTGRTADLLAAAFFWNRVVQHHSFATGGHGTDEYFGRPDQFTDRIDGRTAESCNVYNMLKLTRRMFALHPNETYAAFHERALFNHILGSIDPENGETCYMVPVGRGVQREYTNLFHSFTCCIGTGMESHALHGDGIFYESGDTLYLNIYTPSTAHWQSRQTRLELQTDFPIGETATLLVEPDHPQELTLAIRRPAWAGDGFEVRINTHTADNTEPDTATSATPPGSYVRIRRTWHPGDQLHIRLPKRLRLEPLPDNPNRTALLWGPLVLAGDLGPERGRGRNTPAQERIPVFVAANRPVEEWLLPVEDKPGHFRTAGVGQPRDIDFVPFFQLHRRTYAVYWDLFTPDSWALAEAEYAAEQERQRQLEEATIAYVQPGEMQPERDFNYQAADGVRIVRALDQPGRRGGDWFAFDLPTDPKHPMALVITYFSGERRRAAETFEILVDGQAIAAEQIESSQPERLYPMQYPIPPALAQGKERVTIRFQKAGTSGAIPGIYGIRLIHTPTQPETNR